MIRFGQNMRIGFRARKNAAFFAVVLLAAFAFGETAFAQDEPAAEDPVARFNAAQDLHEKGDLAGAIKLYDEALKIEPNFPEAEYQKGMAELARGRRDAAEKAFRRAVELREGWTLPMTSLGSLLLDRGEKAEAAKLLEKVIELQPQNAAALIALTELKVNAPAPGPELERLLTAVSEFASKANAGASLLSAKAALELALKRPAAAKASVQKALSAEPANRSALFIRADIALMEGDLDLARQILPSLEKPPSDRAKLLAASIFAAEGKLTEAIAALDSMTDRSSGQALRDRINSSRTTSTAELEKQLENDGRNAVLLGRLCVLLRRDDPVKAITYCRRASEIEPANAAHAIGFGAALVQAKQYDTAAMIFRRILEVVPDNYTARANLASALFQLKRHAEARAELIRLVEAQPKAAGPYLFLGIIYDEAGELLDAMASYQQYLRLADAEANKLDIDKVNLRIPALQKQIDSKRK